MSEEPKTPNPTASAPSPPQITALPSKVPAPTGNLFSDSIQSAIHIFDMPCGRNAFLTGIAGGAGMGFIRGMSTNPLIAGNWAIATFAILSSASWHICQKRFGDERKQMNQVMEQSMPKRSIIFDNGGDQPPSSTDPFQLSK